MVSSDDNSIISLHPTRMEDLGFFNGSFSLLFALVSASAMPAHS